MRLIGILASACTLGFGHFVQAAPIDRQALVTRHNIDWPDLKGAIPLGNGNFAFNADGTGLQTFAGNTMSHWAWHSFPVPKGTTPEDLVPWVAMEKGRLRGPTTPPLRARAWLRMNPHPVNLGRLGFVDAEGGRLDARDFRAVSRKLDLWSGLLSTEFTYGGQPVRVETCVDPARDIVAVRVVSPLLKNRRLGLLLDFPAAAPAGIPDSREPAWNGNWQKYLDQHPDENPMTTTTPPWIGDFANPHGHETIVTLSGGKALVSRTLDDLHYAARVSGSRFELEAGLSRRDEKPPQIVRAVYGDRKEHVDVTEIVISKITRGDREIPVAPATFGNAPSPGNLKQLEVTYRRAGARQTESARIADNTTWVVPGGRSPHRVFIWPKAGEDTLEILSQFSSDPAAPGAASFEEVRTANAASWPAFWKSGGAIDLSGSTDPRWQELERRIVLSQYLMAVNSAGDQPPAEVGLAGTDGWGAKFHMEMIWWHLAHYALWDRWPMAEKALGFYDRTKDVARSIAKNFDYPGFMWPKSTSPKGWHDVNPQTHVLLWKEPHPIFFAELEYRLHPTRETLEKWKEIVYGTADFMAAYATKDADGGGYSLWPVWPAREGPFDLKAKNTFFETAYWRYGLDIAGKWRERLGERPEPQWEAVKKGLAPFPVQNGLYVYEPGRTDTFTERKFDHLDVIAPCGMLPPVEGYDPKIGQRTVREVGREWHWGDLWGWDFPLMAMAAARVGEPALAVDALMNPSGRNRYDETGGNQGGTTPYLPGNGGLLYAVAMMAAGWDGAPNRHAPGFPDDGTWRVRWEGLKPAP